MTGLDPLNDVIIEIATVLTDDELGTIAEAPTLVLHASDERLESMVQVVKEMHGASGLTEEVRRSTTTIEEANSMLLEFLAASRVPKREVPLAGNSIGTDRRFLQQYLPQVESWLHYRNVDVSTIKELARRWRPDVLPSAPEKPTNHRALDDIRASIEELRYYRASMFAPAPATP